MPFTFVDIEAARSRRIVLLFATLVVCYGLGALLLFSALNWEDATYFWAHRWRHPEARGVYPPLRTWPWLLGFALLAAALHWLASVRRMIPRILEAVDARPLDPDDRYHRLLRDVVAEVSAATGGRNYEAVTVNSRSANAFALADFGGRAVIGVSEGLLVRLTRRQLEAVVAHEAAHVAWGDCLTTTICCSMAAVWAGLLRLALPADDDESSGLRTHLTIRSLPLLGVVLLMRGLTVMLNAWLSRQREYRADATAVRLTRDPLAVAEALHVVSADGHAGFAPHRELAPIFIVEPTRSGGADRAAGPAFLSTHPPPQRRIEALVALAHTTRDAMIAGLRNRPPLPAEEPIGLPPRQGRTGAAAISACPQCGGPLERMTHAGAPLWNCAGCSGRLVGRGQFARIVVRDKPPASPVVRALARAILRSNIERRRHATAEPHRPDPARLRCPGCGGEMTRTLHYAVLPHRLEIDRCDGCDLLWFDARELELIEHFSSVGRV